MTFCMPNNGQTAQTSSRGSRAQQKCYCCWNQDILESKDDVPIATLDSGVDEQQDVLKLRILSGAAAAKPILQDSMDAVVESSRQSDYFDRDIEDLKKMEQVKSPAPSTGKRFVFPASRAEYVGEWNGYAREGFGVQKWYDGASYAGQWATNGSHGSGRFEDKKGNVYIGEWEESKASGKGMYKHANQNFSYQGEWLQDKTHGYGIAQLPDGTEYAGQFVRGSRHGYGVLRRDGRLVYMGQWHQDEFHGKGVYNTPAQGEIYGTWSNSRLNGICRYAWADGTLYEGMMKDDLRDGFGVLMWKDGTRFEGFWVAGNMAEQGRLIGKPL
mmetsp:Transcript_49114/g.116944  ORF Transcript_49114/g.116944 Transcript_49114/m.116944 type:complete len:327 (+) Transcript_49114:98-1078(+)